MAAPVPRPRKRRQYRTRHNPMDELDEDMFVRRYRISKGIARDLTERFRASGLCGNSELNLRGQGVSAEERMCVALRYFATGCNYSVIGDYHGIVKGTVSRCVHEVLRFFETIQDEYIVFPQTAAAQEQSSRNFSERYGGKPLVIAAVDGTHIPILTPKENEVAFVNRKGVHSINAMIAVGANRRILLVNAMFPGSVHDSFVLQSSSIYRMADRGRLADYFVLGDSGYGLREYIMTPFLHPSTPAEENYNRWHMSTRVVVEQTIGMLKQRFRCLDRHGGYLYHIPGVCSQIINACACLHNLCLHDHIPVPPIEEEPAQDGPPPQLRYAGGNLDRPPPPLDPGNRQGRAKRDLYVRSQFQ